MTIYAEHIIGLTAHEAAQPDLPASAKTMRARYRSILAAGALQPHAAPRGVGQDGGTFDLDHLAGDGQYVFLSYGPRYRDLRPAHLCYGFVFDAATLIDACGALVGEDLLEDYEDILFDCAEAMDAALPPLPPATDEELAEFAAIFGADPVMLDFMRGASTSRYSDIDCAVRMGDLSVPGAREAQAMFCAHAAELQARKRVSGAAAHAALCEGMEILVPGRLSLSLAVGRIEAGELVTP